LIRKELQSWVIDPGWFLVVMEIAFFQLGPVQHLNLILPMIYNMEEYHLFAFLVA